jgi:hypothetical protein
MHKFDLGTKPIDACFKSRQDNFVAQSELSFSHLINIFP